MYRPWGYDEVKNHEIQSLLDYIILYCSFSSQPKDPEDRRTAFPSPKERKLLCDELYIGISQQPSVGGP